LKNQKKVTWCVNNDTGNFSGNRYQPTSLSCPQTRNPGKVFAFNFLEIHQTTIKHEKSFFCIFFMVVSLALVSCDDDDQVNDGSFNNALTIRDDDDDDNIAPALLQLVTIEFTSDNRVIGYLSGIKFGEGNWSITRQSRVLKLDLDDDDDFLFDDLENEWYISSRTATQITLLEYDDDDDDDDDQAKLVLELVR
jgi:hypothetical protein